MAEDAVRPAIKDILESMCEISDVLKEGGSQKLTLKPFSCYPQDMQPPGWTKVCVCNDSVTLRREI